MPHQSITIRRNPTFKSWTKDTPNGHLDGIDVAIGVTPEQSVNEIAEGNLDWYFESVPPDRLTELKARYPDQVFPFVRNNTTYFFMNERKYPFNKLAVRQAVNYAIDRNALVKIYGGQGSPTENILPPGFGAAYKKHNLYPHERGQGQAADPAGRGGRAPTWSCGGTPRRRRPTRSSTWPACSTRSGWWRPSRRSTSRSTGTRSRPRRAIPRSASRTGTRTTPRPRTGSTCC